MEEKTLQPHQQRVIEEAEQLEDRLSKLLAFINSATFKSLPDAERVRLENQARFMSGYFSCLEDRIATF